jgi:hypothetical protein
LSRGNHRILKKEQKSKMRINIEINDWDDLKQLYTTLTEHFVKQTSKGPSLQLDPNGKYGPLPEVLGKDYIDWRVTEVTPVSEVEPDPDDSPIKKAIEAIEAIEADPEPEEKPKAKPKRKKRTKAEMAAAKAAKAAKEAERAAEPEPQPEPKPEPEPEEESDDNGPLTLERMRQEFRTFAQAHGEKVAFEVIRAYKGVGLAELDKTDYEPLLLQLRMKQEELEKSDA